MDNKKFQDLTNHLSSSYTTCKCANCRKYRAIRGRWKKWADKEIKAVRESEIVTPWDRKVIVRAA